MSIQNKLESIEKQRSDLLSKLLATKSMIRGTFAKVYRKCGKPTCRCVDGKGHLSVRITWTEGAISRTKAISEADEQWVKKMTRQYKSFRTCRQNLRQVNEKINKLIDQLEKEVIDQTNKKRGSA